MFWVGVKEHIPPRTGMCSIENTYEQFHGKVTETKVDFRIFDFSSSIFIPFNSSIHTKKISWSERCKKRHFPRIFDQMARAAIVTNVRKVQKISSFSMSVLVVFPTPLCVPSTERCSLHTQWVERSAARSAATKRAWCDQSVKTLQNL